MYSVYAKTAEGKLISGNSKEPTASAALAEVHKAADAGGLTITKATVKFLENKSAFRVSDARGVAAGTPAKKTGGKR